MTTSASLSVVVPAYNAADTIGECIAALRQQAGVGPYEVIVVDDGSTDDTAALARAAGARVITTARGRPAAARNAGAGAAQGDLVCFTDADCVPWPDWLGEVSAPFDDPAVVATKGTYVTHQTALVARFVQLEYEEKYDRLRAQTAIDFVDTYSCAYRRAVLLANGGFDERFDYLEDQELSFRLADRGLRMVFAERAVVAHRHSDTLARYLRKKATIGYWKAQVVRRFPGRVVRDSHTPQIMKPQMALATLLPALLAAGLVALAAGWPVAAGLLGGAGLLALVFLATTLPFMARAWRRDRAVAVAAPVLLFGRGAALSWGYVRGVLFPRPGIGDAGLGAFQTTVKRATDVVGASVGLLVTFLLAPFLVLLIRLDSAGPVFFRQERVGARGRSFVMYKFRTMRVGAEAQLPALAAARGLVEPVLKLTDDPRLTPAGRFLRRWSLDELPQFWNVLRGEMSLVGPRPEEPRVVVHYPERQRRLSMRPGMTGPMQVYGRANLTMDARARLELDYIDHYSLWRDVSILLLTIPIVLRGEGAQ